MESLSWAILKGPIYNMNLIDDWIMHWGYICSLNFWVNYSSMSYALDQPGYSGQWIMINKVDVVTNCFRRNYKTLRGVSVHCGQIRTQKCKYWLASKFSWFRQKVTTVGFLSLQLSADSPQIFRLIHRINLASTPEELRTSLKADGLSDEDVDAFFIYCSGAFDVDPWTSIPIISETSLGLQFEILMSQSVQYY